MRLLCRLREPCETTQHLAQEVERLTERVEFWRKRAAANRRKRDGERVQAIGFRIEQG